MGIDSKMEHLTHVEWLRKVFDDFGEYHWAVCDADEVEHFVEWIEENERMKTAGKDLLLCDERTCLWHYQGICTAADEKHCRILCPKDLDRFRSPAG